jgi:hypothetical protein
MPPGTSNSNSSSSQQCHILNQLEGQRFVLSVILSFLDEVDGTCALITNKDWSKSILPIYHVPIRYLMQNGIDNSSTVEKSRHRFIPLPIQCPSVLLDRLNSIRLFHRIQFLCRSHKQNNNATNGAGAHPPLKDIIHIIQAYPFNMTAEEIAWHEWTMARTQFMAQQSILEHDDAHDDKSTINNDNNSNNSNNNSNNNINNNSNSKPIKPQQSYQYIWPAKMQLLRYRSPPSQTTYSFKLKFKPQLRVSSSLSYMPPPKILSGATILASYPRSGNSLLRSLLESTTSILTGSDTRPDRTLSKALSELHSLVGEGITSHSKTPVIKTHFPERRGYMMYNSSRVILLVRNPYDAIDSYWNMCCTNTHTDSVSEEIYEKYSDKFQGLAQSEMRTWTMFMRYWLTTCDTTLHGTKSGSENENEYESGPIGNGNGNGKKEQKVGGPSILLVRFEDLVQHTQKVMEDVMTFLTVEDSCFNSGAELHPFWKWRIRHALGLVDGLKGKHTKHVNESRAMGSVTNVAGDCDRSLKTDFVKKVNTSALGSYKPRSLDAKSHHQSKFENSNTQHHANMEDKYQTRKPSSIGKSIGKGRYPEEVLKSMHVIADEEPLWHPSKGRMNMLQIFGYDIFIQGFPLNFDNGREGIAVNWDFIYARSCSMKIRPLGKSKNSAVRVNQGAELRTARSAYGRAMTRWRRSQTCDDTKPFPLK